MGVSLESYTKEIKLNTSLGTETISYEEARKLIEGEERWDTEVRPGYTAKDILYLLAESLGLDPFDYWGIDELKEAVYEGIDLGPFIEEIRTRGWKTEVITGKSITAWIAVDENGLISEENPVETLAIVIPLDENDLDENDDFTDENVPEYLIEYLLETLARSLKEFRER